MTSNTKQYVIYLRCVLMHKRKENSWGKLLYDDYQQEITIHLLLLLPPKSRMKLALSKVSFCVPQSHNNEYIAHYHKREMLTSRREKKG